jgi:SagB-type dehydrogenase family enzyme
MDHPAALAPSRPGASTSKSTRDDVGVDVVERRFAFRPGVTLSLTDGHAVLAHPWGCHRLVAPPEGVWRGLDSLAAGFAGDAALAQAVAGGRPAGDPAVLRETAGLYQLMARLPALFAVGLFHRGCPAVVAVPMSDRAQAPGRRLVRPATPVALPRHAFFRRLPSGGPFVLESPLSLYRAEWHDPAALAAVTGLAVAGAGGEPASGAGSCPGAGLSLEVTDLLVAVGLLACSAHPDEEERPAVAVWDFHDLVFHTRSRSGRHDYPFGGLFRHAGSLPPLPAVKPPPAGEAIDLARPEYASTVASDPPLTEVLEARRSVRSYADEPVTRDQVGELLYRALRVRAQKAAGVNVPYDVTDRPFPTGGGAGDLEVYVTVARCRDLDPGIYHYDAAGHRLRPVPHADADRHRLLVTAWQATAGTVEPHVLLTITSRFGRLSWKYSSIAYACTLKHVGVVYQTLYLVATAMGLAPCALGSGNPDDAARAFGLDWTEESSVGEFLIGPARAPCERPTDFADVIDQARISEGASQK